MLNIILDLDGTLIQQISDEFQVPLIRPYLYDFLEYLFIRFNNVSIWSAANKEWILYNLDNMNISVNNFHFIWDGTKVTRHTKIIKYQDIHGKEILHEHKYYSKRLKKIFKKYPSYNKRNTLIIDDSQQTFSDNYGNAIHINTWKGSPSDDSLINLMNKLEKILYEYKRKKNVRKIYKSLNL